MDVRSIVRATGVPRACDPCGIVVDLREIVVDLRGIVVDLREIAVDLRATCVGSI